MKYLLLITVSLALLTPSFAQENRKENGVKVGAWAHKDQRDFVYAAGNYTDGIKTGRWRYFISPVSRYTQVADVLGTYDATGKKTGRWTFISSQTRIQVEAEFVNGLMEGQCLYFSPEGTVLAMGTMSAGLRHGQWLFYYKGKEMARGYYQDGIKIGDWNYDYFPENDLHVKGVLNYDNGAKSGRLEYYKVSRHPKFGFQEFLAGLGLYKNGKKVGRWIEYQSNLKGELIEAGNYNSNGKREGFWKTTLNGRNYEAVTYNNGVKDGVFKRFHDNGSIQYQSTYKNGIEVGEFVRYFDNGNMEEKGTSRLIPNNGTIKKDTAYFELHLPYEVHFQLIEEPRFERLTYQYVDWITTPNYSLEPAEIDRRYQLYVKDYGFEPNKRIRNITSNTQQSVRQGPYKAFYRNGKLKLEGNYYPTKSLSINPKKNIQEIGFTRDGKWVFYDDSGYVIRTMFYQRGKLLRTLDDKGKEIGNAVQAQPSESSPTGEPVDQGRPLDVRSDN